MNFTQLQERVRLELLRRIERGTLSVSLLARQTGLGQGHISNFLRLRRQLSLGSLDRIMAAQRMGVADLLPSGHEAGRGTSTGQWSQIPLVSHAVALFEPYIRPSGVERILTFPAEMVGSWMPRCTASRKMWERFVAVKVDAADARAMEPVILGEAVVVLDRQYNSFKPYREGRNGAVRVDGNAGNLYGVRVGSQLLMRYGNFKSNRLVLRPHGLGFPVEVVQVEAGGSPNDLLVGRVALVWNEL